mgnify:CR=1 FL=1
MAWKRQSQVEVDSLFAGLKARDPLGHGIHVLFALPACFLAAFPTTWLEWAWWPVTVCFAVRMLSHHRVLGPLVWEWPARLALAWVLWAALSLAWTAGTGQQWLAEWGVARYALLIPALWPVMNERRWLVGALALGALCGNLSQVAHAIGIAAEIPWLVWPRLEDRNSGWWDPVVGGSVLCAALGLHMAGLSLGRSVSERIVGGVLSAATLIAIAATGTRGAWIGAAGVIGVAVMIAGWRAVRGQTPTAAERSFGSSRMVIAAALVVVLCGAAVWFAAGETITKRVGEAREELTRAVEHGDYSTFTGARLTMWGWGVRAVAAHPIRGVGGGGYSPWVQGKMQEQSEPETGIEASPLLPHGHAHSWFLHAAATTGVVGLGIMVALVVVCVMNGMRETAGAAGTECRPTRGYDAGPALAMVGLVCAGLFDSIHVNQQTAYWLWVLVALCMARRPREAIGARAKVTRQSPGAGGSA